MISMRFLGAGALLLGLVVILWIGLKSDLGVVPAPVAEGLRDSEQAIAKGAVGDRGDLKRDNASSERVAVDSGLCVITGRVVDNAGSGVAAIVELQCAAWPSGEGTAANALGYFAVRVPTGGGNIQFRCASASGLRTEQCIAIPVDATTFDVGSIVLEHYVSLTLLFNVDRVGLERLGVKIDGKVSVMLAASGGLASQYRSELVEFNVFTPETRALAEIRCPPGAVVSWQFVNDAGYVVPLCQDAVPVGVVDFTSTYSFGARSVLIGRVVSPAGIGLSGSVVQVASDAPTRQTWEIVTNSDGVFACPTASDAFGGIRVKMAHPPNGDIRSGMVKWSPGEAVTLVADLDHFLRLRVMRSGRIVERCVVSLRPHLVASGKGLPRGKYVNQTEAGFISEFRSLAKGQRLFVHLPECGEYLYEMPRQWAAADGVLEIPLSAPIAGQIGFKGGDLPGAGAPRHQFVTVSLFEQGRDSSPASYRIQISPSQLASGLIAEQILPGTYRCEYSWYPYSKSVEVVVAGEGITWVNVEFDAPR